MRFKTFNMVDSEKSLFHFLLGESKKRMYICTWNDNHMITGFKKFDKRKDEGYFLIYGDE